MKKVCVPRLAVYAKYASSAGDRTLSCMYASHGVSQRTMGMSLLRSAFRHLGSLLASVQALRALASRLLRLQTENTHSGRDAYCPHPAAAPFAAARGPSWRLPRWWAHHAADT
jgi:hypothetical protein